MNEVTQIHLGRQSFTIAIDAQRELRDYLAGIKAQVKDQGVVDEVELRMAELLTEHGVTGEKVILPADITFLKNQLGEPQDFGDESEGVEAKTTDEPAPAKRLFRDTQTGMLAGVASGLANYFGLDVWIFRLLFVVGIFTGGWGILLYLALWLVVPEAKTPSDRLQMVGKPVTVQSLKEVVARADVRGATQRANTTLAGPINSIFHVLLKICGLALIVIGLSLLFAFFTFESYVLLHSGNLFSQNIFPVGLREHMLLNMVGAVALLLTVIVIVLGIAIFKQRWPLKSWVTGTLIGLILVGLAGSIGLGAAVAPQVRDRYNASLHTSVRDVKPFTSVTFTGPSNDIQIEYDTAANYSVSFKYLFNPALANIKTSVTNNVLTIDTTRFDNDRHCSSPCIPKSYNLTVTVSAPVDFQINEPPFPGFPVKPSRNLMIEQG